MSTTNAPVPADRVGEPLLVERTRPFLDVADLSDVEFGKRDLMWWGTLGFIVIEGFTLALCVVVYLYLWKNFPEWPPAGTERPTLFWPSVQMAVMLASLPVVWRTMQASKRFDFPRVRMGQTIAAVWMLAITVLRLVELGALHVKWNQNAYGSAAWLVVGSHGTLIAIKLVESVGFALQFWFAPIEKKHFSDVADDGFYWFFLVLSWIPVFLLCYVGPWIAS